MIIAKDKVVSVSYELRLNSHEGEVVESVGTENPLAFIFGVGNMLPKFEDNLAGLKVSDAFQFKLECVDAYGQPSDEQIVDLPKSMFEVDGAIDEAMLEVGNTLPMQDQYGNRFNGVVLEVTDETVSMDFNHPLAGEDLYFTGKVIEVRDASAEELSHGHLHGGCGCGCGDGECDDDCDCDDQQEDCGCGCGK